VGLDLVRLDDRIHSAAILHDAVPHVVVLRAEEQVIDRHASADIAAVEDTETSGDRAVCKLPGDPVRLHDVAA
jgi:hypothetical protein